MKEEQSYWTKRYQEESTGWDIGYPSTPLKEYIDQLEDKSVAHLSNGTNLSHQDNVYCGESPVSAWFPVTHTSSIIRALSEGRTRCDYTVCSKCIDAYISRSAFSLKFLIIPID